MDKNLNILQNPSVTVMMPVRNGAKYIRKAIESILCQTFTDFELLILDDGSTDQTVNIVRSYKDKRIRLIQNDKSLNLAEARQKAVVLSRGKYIAYLDSDDRALPQRLAEQIQFLNKNSDISVVGSWVEIIDEKGNSKRTIWKHTSSPDIIPSILLFRNCFTQSSVLLKKECLLTTSYRSKYWPAPDFDLWARLSQKYKMANIPKVLTYYRVHQENSSMQKQKEIKKCTQLIFSNSLKRFGFMPTLEEIKVHDSLERQSEEFTDEEINNIQIWLLKLHSKNQKTHIYSDKIFERIVADYWFKVFCLSANKGLTSFRKYYSSGLVRKNKFNWKKILILFLLSFFNKSRVIDITSDPWIKLIY